MRGLVVTTISRSSAEPRGPMRTGYQWVQYDNSSYSQYMLVYRGSTAAVAWTELFLDGAAVQFAMSNNSALFLEAMFVGRDNTATEIGAWKYTAVVTRDAAAASTVVENTVKSILLNQLNSAAGDVRITADVATGTFKVEVLPGRANATRWTVGIRVSEAKSNV